MDLRGNLVHVAFPDVFEAFSNLKSLKDRFHSTKSNGLGKKINGEMSKIKRIVQKQTGIDISTFKSNAVCDSKIKLPKHLLTEILRMNASIRVIRNQRGEKQACLR